MGSPFLGNVQPYIRTHPAQLIAMSRIVLHCLHYIYCFFPLFSFVRHRDRRSSGDQLHRDDSFSSAEQPGKQNPLDHSDITHSFSLMLALDFATVLIDPILMHNLFIVTTVDTLPVILKLLSIGWMVNHW
jgi:hypothetical protein